MLQFLFSPLGRVVMVVAAIGFVLLSAYTALKIHDAGVRREALARFNQSQLELVIKQNAESQRRYSLIQEQQKQILESIEKLAEEDRKTSEALAEYLTTDEARRSDRPSSDVLKETIRRLGEGR